MKAHIQRVHIITQEGQRKRLPICETLKDTPMDIEAYRVLIKGKHNAKQVLFTYNG